MKRQSLIENYFKSKGSPFNSSQIKIEPMTDENRKSEKRRPRKVQGAPTPAKCPKEGNENTSITDVVILSDDDEILWETKPMPYFDLTQVSSSTEEAGSACSSQTILYELSPDSVLGPHTEYSGDPEKEQRSKSPAKSCINDAEIGKGLVTPKKKLSLQLKKSPVQNHTGRQAAEHPSTSFSESRENSTNALKTPQKTPLLTKTKSLSKSPTIGQKYFSPAKKRNQRAPAARKNLSADLDDAHLVKCVKNELFSIVCQGMDDKTIFLLTTINKFLQDTTLHHLLDAEALNLLNQCLIVLKPGMRLICRLYWRKEGWYKREQCKTITVDGKEKEPIDDPTFDSMIVSLIDKGLLTQSDVNNISLEEYTSMLSKGELTQVCKELNLKTNSKQEAVEALTRFSKKAINISHFFQGGNTSNSKRVLKLLNAASGPCYKLTDKARAFLNRLYRIMYLGVSYSIIQEKKLELVLLYDKIQRETYPVHKQMQLDNASVVFKTRDEFEQFIKAQDLYGELLNETHIQKKCEYVKQAFHAFKEIDTQQARHMPEWLRRYTAGNVYVKIMEAGVQELKKDQRHLLALTILTTLIDQDIFRCHKKAEWYAEKALILHKVLCRSDEAGEVLLTAFKASDLREEAKDLLRPRARKIAAKVRDDLKKELLEHAKEDIGLEKKLGGIHVYKQPMERTSSRGKQKFKTLSKDGVVSITDAEEYCIFHYICSGEFTHGQHWEGRIVTTIFFLLFWDIIYSKPSGVPGVFMSYYQKNPLDMYTESFYTNRKEAIDAWLVMIETSTIEKLIKIMHDTWNSRPECELSGINRAIGWANIQSVASILGCRGLRAICGRLATNYGQAHSGFPDLTLWHETTGKLKFVEVKTDADKPSIKQMQWMSYLRQHDIDTEFCYLGGNTTRQRCRSGKDGAGESQASQPKTRKRKNKVGKARKSQASQAATSEAQDDLADFQITTQVKSEL